MAEFEDVLIVPQELPRDFTIPESELPEIQNPFNELWWTWQTATGVPEHVMGWLVAQGWRILGVANDNTTVPPTTTYTLGTNELSPLATLNNLCKSFVIAANEARQVNSFRYNEVVGDWTEMLASTRDQHRQQIDRHNVDIGAYVTDLNSFMADINELSTSNIGRLELEHSYHKDTARGLLNNLGTTERARINEEFTAKLSVQLQTLIDQGSYNDIVVLDITERNHRDRDEQIQMLNDRLMREKLVNEHQLYGQQENLADHRHRAIVEKMNTAVARLEGWKSVAAENRQLMAYQLDERNKLLIGLYSFVERREDIAPEWKDMASMIAGLGDAAGGWIQP